MLYWSLLTDQVNVDPSAISAYRLREAGIYPSTHWERHRGGRQSIAKSGKYYTKVMYSTVYSICPMF